MPYVSHSLKTSPVQDPKKHFINYIILKIDNKIIKKNTYDVQETIDGQKVVFNVNEVKKVTRSLYRHRVIYHAKKFPE